jgi:hypothetical protein
LSSSAALRPQRSSIPNNERPPNYLIPFTYLECTNGSILKRNSWELIETQVELAGNSTTIVP